MPRFRSPKTLVPAYGAVRSNQSIVQLGRLSELAMYLKWNVESPSQISCLSRMRAILPVLWRTPWPAEPPVLLGDKRPLAGEPAAHLLGPNRPLARGYAL